MNWDAIGAIAETLAAAGVIASLIYVGLQMRQNSRLIDQSIVAARSGVVHDVNASYFRFYEFLAQDAELCDIYQRGIRGEALTEIETGRFESLIIIYVIWMEDADHQHRSGLYFEEDETDPIADMAYIHRPLLSSPIGRQWWSQNAEEFTTESVYNTITGLLAQWDTPES
jgi:hypothetical protein